MANGVLTPVPRGIADARVDVIHNGQAYGDVASRLLANHMNPYALKTNATLRHEEWMELDTAIQAAILPRLPFVNFMISRGLEYRMRNGLAATVLAYEDVADMNDAEVGMDAAGESLDDRLNFEIKYLPLPCVYKSFSVNIRQLEAGRLNGAPIDTTQASVAAQKVAEKIEQIAICGASSFLYGGGYLRGVLDFDYVNTGSMVQHWDHSAATGATILADVLAMKQASLDDGHGGPWVLLVPPAYETHLDEDYSLTTGRTITIRARLLEVGGIEAILICDKQTADKVALVELQPQTFRIVNGLEPMSVEWDEMGGLRKKFRVLSIMVPQPRADQANKCGIQVWS